MDLDALRYPIGEFNKPLSVTPADIEKWIGEIESFPENLSTLTRPLERQQLNWIYRPGGWCIKQVIHHCADSHMNSYIRFKLALTEDIPLIRPYFEDRWAMLADSLDDNITVSLDLLKSLHRRWVILLRSLSADDFQREFEHPEHGQRFSLAVNTGIYAWHGRHHLAHIRQAIRYKGRF